MEQQNVLLAQGPGADKTAKASVDLTKYLNGSLSRRDEFTAHFAAAILSRQSGRNPVALAKEVVTLVDAFLTELDKVK